jgi:hypothetical protein
MTAGLSLQQRSSLNRATAIMRPIAMLAGALFLATAPIQAKTDCKTELRYSKFYNHPAYLKGFDDGYDGMEYNNPFTYRYDQLLYDIGFEDGDEAYLDNNIKHRRTRCRF